MDHSIMETDQGKLKSKFLFEPLNLSFCCIFNSRISETRFGGGLPRSAHAHAQSDSTVWLVMGMRRMREPAAKLSLRNSAIENATKGQQWAPEAEKMFIEKTNLSD